ncbi:regulator of RNase E activity RraA [Anaerospora hongkongensis]|uniref:Putative 4-hydroxy-4-methyl-2-oxoglutarate aldolase n=1 Tax=Anaerospora hongkongensis TaxID=244830 RepID=A0A4R1Q1L3_9FIRM|nr:RraA family protein [Anaerospora hongkongensis]TCL39849.1 regulator of RNase E activity RraA [Anaerospora hongkongensis]
MTSIVEKFREIPGTCISDAMDGLRNLDPMIKPLKEEYKISGRAFTVRLPAGDNLMLLKAIRDANPGDILVVDAKSFLYTAVAGDFVIGLAATLGLGGIVIDGTIRDILSIKNSGFPVFCKGGTLACSKKIGAGEINVSISSGGTVISPGDIIVGDVNGVTVVPKDSEDSVLKAAIDKLNKDEVRAQNVLGNPEAAARWIDELLGLKN